MGKSAPSEEPHGIVVGTGHHGIYLMEVKHMEGIVCKLMKCFCGIAVPTTVFLHDNAYFSALMARREVHDGI